MNSTIALMRRHRSIRRFREEAVDDEHIAEAVRAGQAASTSSAVQAYCLIRVTDEAARRELVTLTGNQEKVARCGAFFVICGDTRRHRLLCRREKLPYEGSLEAFLLAVIDASLFAQNLVLAFESLGYGTCYIGGLRNDLDGVQRLLGFPEGVFPFYGLCIGVPDQDPLPRPRLPLEAVSFENRYPDDKEMLRLIDAYDGAYREYLERRGGPPSAWSKAMADMFSHPRRRTLGKYYRGQGASLEE